jgi:SAM-dependent methyltransferase
MVELARRFSPDIRFDEASADALPYADGSFEAVVCAFGIGHFPDAEPAMAELARVAAPDGFVALSWWEGFSRNRINGIFHEVIAKLGISAPDILPQGPPMDRFSDPRTFADFMRAAGLTDVKVESVASTHRLAGIDQLWELAMGSFARASSLICAQTDDMQRTIRQAVAEAARQYASADDPDCISCNFRKEADRPVGMVPLGGGPMSVFGQIKKGCRFTLMTCPFYREQTLSDQSNMSEKCP